MFGLLFVGFINRVVYNWILEVDNVLFFESWFGSEGNIFCGLGDEVMVLVLVVVKVVRDVVFYKNVMDVKKREF